jgi:serpin B
MHKVLLLLIAMTLITACSRGEVTLSPTSILGAIVMLHEGSTGDTRDEVARLFAGASEASYARHLGELHNELIHQRSLQDDRVLIGIDEGEPQFRISPSNSIWIQEGYKYKRSYMDVVRSELGGTLRTVDMIGNPPSAASEINKWVDQATNGRIGTMISESDLSQLSRVIFCNALYFKATWMRPFAPPTPGEFHLLDGSTVHAQMMSGGGFGKRYAVANNLWAVELSYVIDDAAMILIVPSVPEADALLAVERELPTILEDLEYKPLGLFGTLTVPEFSVTSKLNIAGISRDLGVNLLISQDADLSAISDERPLWVDNILHGASIQVDMYGTEAAAVTMSMLIGALPPPQTIDLVVDRPFIFVVLDKPTDTILFLGRVADPTNGDLFPNAQSS